MKKALPSFRNGLKWRDGRPRWEPSPASRAHGIKGRDLKDLAGNFIADRGKAVSMADARHDWAAIYREALADSPRGLQARDDIKNTLAALVPPEDDDGRLMRRNVIDLIDLCRAFMASVGEATKAASSGRTVADMVEGYFAKAPPRAAATLKLYRVQSNKFIEKFGDREISDLNRGDFYDWYQELCSVHGLSTSNTTISTAGAMYKWAMRQNPPWINSTPVNQLDMTQPEGRLVFWPFEMEMAFVAFCDANSFEDVADAVTGCCWTGARQIDLCDATLGALSAATWRFTPVKTHKRKREALPGITPAVTARVERRRRELLKGPVNIAPDRAPFLWNPETNKPHTSRSIGDRFRDAREAAVAAVRAGTWPQLDGIEGLRLQDTRDTCVTRLARSGVPLDNIPPWSGHSPEAAKTILVHHYKALMEEEAIESARALLKYADASGFKIAQ